jgi:hypothetical protein
MAEHTMLRRAGALALALLWLGAPCGAQGSIAQFRIASTPRAQAVRIGRITFELPPGFVADSTANIMDGFHPPTHEWHRGKVSFVAFSCTSGHGMDACFFAWEKRGKQVAQWKLGSTWTATIESRRTTKRRVLVAHYASADSSWAVKALLDTPLSADEAELMQILRGARLDAGAPRS